MIPSPGVIRFCDEESELIVKLKLFSLSAIMTDQNESRVASMKRSSWWRLNFLIHADQETYKFCSGSFDNTLLAETAKDKYMSMGSTNLFDSKGIMIAELTRNEVPSGTLTLKIAVSNHHKAFMFASCLYYKTVLAVPGYAI